MKTTTQITNAKKEIEELENKIKHNKFVNDMSWAERASDNIFYQKRINELNHFINY